MNDYTPPIEHVRWRYWSHNPGQTVPEFLEPTAEHFAGAEFDRFIAEVERAAEERGWERGKVAGESIRRRRWSDEPNAPEPVNPYRKETR